MVETKALSNINDPDVQAKKVAAERYCKYASEFTAQHGGKVWKYLLLPHDQVSRTKSLDYLQSIAK